jgi:5'-3' exonuclease
MNLIIDASNIYHRSFWMANKMSSSDESEIGSFHAFIFLQSLKSYNDKFKPQKIYCVWDKKQQPHVPCFRKVIAAETYKTNRDDEKTKKVYEEYEIVESFINALGCYNVFPFSLEGDDVIAFLCKNLPGEKLIISSDKDLLQLVNRHVSFYDVNKKSIIKEDNFEQSIGISLNNYVQYKCLIGDPADNIAKVCTPTKAKKVINKELQLNEEQQKQYELNYILTDLSDSYNRQENELSNMQQYFQQLSATSNFGEFMNLCSKYNMSSIVAKKADWQQSFFSRNKMIDIVNLLKGD